MDTCSGLQQSSHWRWPWAQAHDHRGRRGQMARGVHDDVVRELAPERRPHCAGFAEHQNHHAPGENERSSVSAELSCRGTCHAVRRPGRLVRYWFTSSELVDDGFATSAMDFTTEGDPVSVFMIVDGCASKASAAKSGNASHVFPTVRVRSLRCVTTVISPTTDWPAPHDDLRAAVRRERTAIGSKTGVFSRCDGAAARPRMAVGPTDSEGGLGSPVRPSTDRPAPRADQRAGRPPPCTTCHDTVESSEIGRAHVREQMGGVRRRCSSVDGSGR